LSNAPDHVSIHDLTSFLFRHFGLGLEVDLFKLLLFIKSLIISCKLHYAELFGNSNRVATQHKSSFISDKDVLG
jgi:hypothetical protein